MHPAKDRPPSDHQVRQVLFRSRRPESNSICRPLVVRFRTNCRLDPSTYLSKDGRRIRRSRRRLVPSNYYLTVTVRMLHRTYPSHRNLECPAILVPVEMRQTGMRGAWHGTRKETYGGTDCKFAAAD